MTVYFVTEDNKRICFSCAINQVGHIETRTAILGEHMKCELCKLEI